MVDSVNLPMLFPSRKKILDLFLGMCYDVVRKMERAGGCTPAEPKEKINPNFL